MGLFTSHYFSITHQILVIVHVLSALLSIVVAPLVMWVKKGGKVHRQWGKVYFWGMFVANTTAIVLLFYRFNIFLLGVTVLSFYGAVTGYRVLYRKRPLSGSGPHWFDWSAAVVTLLTGLALLGWGVWAMLGNRPFGLPSGGNVPIILIIFPIIFGIIISSNAITDLRNFIQPSNDKQWWWYYHMDRMLGSYIGLTTALMVQQVGPRLPQNIAWVVWILPAVIGTVAISRWINSYKQQFARADHQAA